MSITLYTGTPGSGKSLHAAQRIRYQINIHHEPVLANFPLAAAAPVRDRSLYTFRPNHAFSPEVVTSWADAWWAAGHDFAEDALLLVLDECQILFNARNWNAKDRLPWLEFFSQHRKYGVSVLLIAQSAKMIDNQFRMLVESEVNHRSLRHGGAWGRALSAPFGGRLCRTVTTLFQVREKTGSEWFVGSRKDCAMYDTHARFERAPGT